MPGQTMLDDIANDLSLWIDQTANQVALAFAPARAPFAAQVTEEQKLEFYRMRLFNPDGTPNPQGRQAEMQRLGPEGFANVYKAVVKRYPELKVAPPPPIEVPAEWPQAGPPGPPGAPPGPPGGLPPGPGGPGPLLPRPPGFAPPRPPMMPPPGVRPMASGGVVTQPTLALIGEAGPEAVVPLADYQYQQPNYFAGTPAMPFNRDPGFTQGAPVGVNRDPGFTQGAPVGFNRDPGFTQGLADYQYQQPNYFAGTPDAPPAPAYVPPKPGEIEAYIRQAAQARAIDPDIATKVAYFEGGRDLVNNPQQPPFTDPAVLGDFSGNPWRTGKSWWPYQLHYGGPGYEQYGTTAGLGNRFTEDTGYQPGDPAAWQASVDYALDNALKGGWSQWYGAGPKGANVGPWQGIPRR